ncbi:unnamed protein product [Closterium sp. Yama58-4]|nr:unnamed protein product [Closterium sp. Yama58-4]
MAGDGSLFSFGWGQYGQCGHGTSDDHLSPTRLASFAGLSVTAIAAGLWHSLALVLPAGSMCGRGAGTGDGGSGHADVDVDGADVALEGGDVYSWGGNQFGQLGTGDTAAKVFPTLLDCSDLDTRSVKAISCGARHSAAVTTDGALFVWGSNKFGQLGIGHIRDKHSPHMVSMEKHDQRPCGGITSAHNKKRQHEHCVQSGRSFELHCSADTPVDSVCDTLASLTAIPPQDQLLICRDVRLEPGRQLGAYQLPDADADSSIHDTAGAVDARSRSASHGRSRPVFLFNKMRLLPKSPPPAVEEIEEVIVPEVIITVGEPGGEPLHPLDRSGNPLLRAIPSYERQFRQDLLQAQAYLAASQSRFDTCRRLLQEQHTQAEAVRSGSASMEAMALHIVTSFADFQSTYKQQHSRHELLLRTFHRNLRALHSCRLLAPVRVATGWQSLVQLAKEPRLQQAFSECHVAHAQMATKVAELEQQFQDTRAGIEELIGGGAGGSGETAGSGPGADAATGAAGADSRGTGGGRAGAEGRRREAEVVREVEGMVEEGHRLLEEQEVILGVLGEAANTDCTLSCATAPLPVLSPYAYFPLSPPFYRFFLSSRQQGSQHSEAASTRLHSLIHHLPPVLPSIPPLPSSPPSFRSLLLFLPARTLTHKDLNTVRQLLHDCTLSVTHSSSSSSPSFSPSFSPSASPSRHLPPPSPSSSPSSSSSTSSSSSPLLQPIEAVAALDPICTVHSSSLLPRISAIDSHLAALVQSARASKIAMTNLVHTRMQAVARWQSRVRGFRNRLHAFREAISHQDALFSLLSSARALRGAYADCLGEIARRKGFGMGDSKTGADNKSSIAHDYNEDGTDSSAFPSHHHHHHHHQHRHHADVDDEDADVSQSNDDVVGGRSAEELAVDNMRLRAELIALRVLGAAGGGASGAGSSGGGLSVAGAPGVGPFGGGLSGVGSSAGEGACGGEGGEGGHVEEWQQLVQALHLREQVVRHVQVALRDRQAQVQAYERRIRDLEGMLGDMSRDISRDTAGDMGSGMRSNVGGGTSEDVGRDKGSVGTSGAVRGREEEQQEGKEEGQEEQGEQEGEREEGKSEEERRREVAGLQEELQTTLSELQLLQSKLTATESQLSAAQSNLSAGESNLATVQSKLTAAEARLAAAESQLAEARDESARLDALLSERNAELDARSVDINNITVDYNACKEELGLCIAERERNQSQLELLQQELDQASQQQRRDVARVADLEADVARKDAELARLAADLAAAEVAAGRLAALEEKVGGPVQLQQLVMERLGAMERGGVEGALAGTGGGWERKGGSTAGSEAGAGLDRQVSDVARHVAAVEESTATSPRQGSDMARQVAALEEALRRKTAMLAECQLNCAHLENRLHEARSAVRTEARHSEAKAEAQTQREERNEGRALKCTELSEWQRKCADLETRLHEARSEARTMRCAADRRAAESGGLRAAAVRLRGLMERINRCLQANSLSAVVEGLSGLADSLGEATGAAAAIDLSRSAVLAASSAAMGSIASSMTSSAAAFLPPPPPAAAAAAAAGHAAPAVPTAEEWVVAAVRAIAVGVGRVVERGRRAEGDAHRLARQLQRTSDALVDMSSKHELVKQVSEDETGWQ